MKKDDISLKDYMQMVVEIITPLAKDNTEGAYEDAKDYVKRVFRSHHIPLTVRQITKIVNSVWDNVNGGEIA